MNEISRRESLKVVFGTVAAGMTVGMTASMLPKVAEAAPVTVEKDLAAKADDLLKEEVQWGPPPGWRRRYWRRRRRWVCWWRRGRRVCAWR